MSNLLDRIFGDFTLVFNRQEEYAHNRQYILWFNIFANSAVMFYGGNYFTGLLLRMGADNNIMGLVTIITYAANLAAVFAPLLLERFRRRKAFLIASRGASYALQLLFITALPYLGIANGTKLSWVLVAIAAANLIGSLTGSGLTVWHLQSIPQNVRSSFFQNINMIIGILNMLMLNLAGVIADWFKGMGQELLGITLLRLIALAMAAGDLYNLSRLREYPYPEATAPNLLSIFTNPLKIKPYRAVMTVIFLWTLTATLPGPFYTVYLLQDLHISYSFLSAVNLLNIPVLLVVLPAWSRLIRARGDIRLFPVLAALCSLHFLALSVINAGNYTWLYPTAVFYWFVASCGITQVASLIPYKFIPEANQSNYLSFYNTINMVAAMLGTVLGQQLILHTDQWSTHLLGMSFGNKQLLVAVTGAAILGAAVAMAFIHRWLKRNYPSDS